MAEQKNIKKRKLVDWNKKSTEDNSRISNRMQNRETLKDSATTQNDITPTLPPKATGAPLLRLKNKIQEIYNQETEDDTTLFNITLFEEEEHDKTTKQVENTHTITKQQQLTGKLNLIMDTALLAEEIGLSPKITLKDAELANTAEYSLKDVRRKTVHEKIEKPLGLKGKIPEKNIKATTQGLKKAKETLPEGALAGFPAQNAEDFIELDKEDMAKLILKKSGRRKKAKQLSEIAKGLNQFTTAPSEENNKENS